MERADQEYIHDIAHFQVFLNWYALGGMMRGISLTEAATLPSTLLKDVIYFASRMSTIKKQQKDLEKAAKDVPDFGAG